MIVLTATRDQPAGESVGPLRANADAAEILTERASSIVSDIQSAAEQLQNWCSKKFSAPEDLGQGPSTNPNPQPIRDPNQPIVRGPAETVQPGLVPGLSGILEGIADGTSNTGEDSLGQSMPEQGPHDPGNVNSGILGSGNFTDIAQSDPADSLPADMQDGPDLSGLLEGVRDGDQGLDDGSHFPSSRPPRDEPPGMSLGGPREPPPQDHDEDQQSWGRHRLVFIDPDSGQNKPVPLELTWQPDGENMATARLSLSAAAPHELRDSLRDEGVELPITISAKRTDGTFIGRGPDLDRMMQAFCVMLYSIDVGISAFFGLEPTDDPPRVLRSAAHFDVQANEIKMLLKVDYRQGTHRESHELPFRAIRF